MIVHGLLAGKSESLTVLAGGRAEGTAQDGLHHSCQAPPFVLPSCPHCLPLVATCPIQWQDSLGKVSALLSPGPTPASQCSSRVSVQPLVCSRRWPVLAHAAQGLKAARAESTTDSQTQGALNFHSDPGKGSTRAVPTPGLTWPFSVGAS